MVLRGGNVNKEKILYILQKYKDANKEIQLQNRYIKELEDNFYCPLKSTNEEPLDMPPEISNELKELRIQRKETLVFKDEVHKEIDHLDTLHKLIIYNFYIEGMRWEQISRRLSYSVRQCKNIRTTALKQLEKRFEKNKIIKGMCTNC